MKSLALLALIALVPVRALCGDVTVSVRTSQGRPAPEAVVTIEAPHSGPIRFPWTQAMAQQNLQFDPFVLIVPVGADVAFPNRDAVRHHVYSFSPAHPFELKLYGQDETRSVRFDHAGVDRARAATSTTTWSPSSRWSTRPIAAKTDAEGQAVLRGAAGRRRAVLHVWHPYLKAPGNEVTRTVTVPPRAAPRARRCGVELRNPPDRRGSLLSPMFRHLRTKLTVLYAGLFGGGADAVPLAVYTAIVRPTRRGVVRGELVASGTVFDRVWTLRADQLAGRRGPAVARLRLPRGGRQPRRGDHPLGARQSARSGSASTWPSSSASDGRVTGADGPPLGRRRARRHAGACRASDDPSGVAGASAARPTRPSPRRSCRRP